MKESFELSKINRKASDEKYSEGDLVLKKIEKLTASKWHFIAKLNLISPLKSIF